MKENTCPVFTYTIFEDYALIRRELFERDYMNRTDDCRKYWKK